MHVFSFLLGMLVGTLACIYGVVRTSIRIWPMQRKLLDWPKVERLAAGDALDG